MRVKGQEARLGVRLFLLLALSLFPFLLSAQNALILIQHDRAGPNLPSADYFFAEWIRWPQDQPGRNNRILSLAAGVDLRAEQADMGFKTVNGDARASRNGPSLQARGFFSARKAHLGDAATHVVENPKGGVSPSVLLLALDDPSRMVRPQPFTAALPTRGLVLYEATEWDDAVKIAARLTGRSLIVEYPPEDRNAWSRYWKRGSWPSGVPIESDLAVPGLVHARNALTLLLHPERFAWRPQDAGRWGGPNRWLEHGHGVSGFVLFAWFDLAAFILAWALAQVMNEDRGPFVSEMLVLVALSPAAIVLAGALGRFGGIEAWPLWLTLAPVALYGLTSLGGFVVRRSALGAHPLWPVCLVGLATMILFDPLWSDLSGRFGRWDLDVPSLAVGAWVAYLAGAMAFAPGRWFGRAIGAAMLLWGATAGPWWIGGHSAFLLLPAVALAATEGLFRPALLLLLAALPTGILRFAREGVAWNPENLLLTADEQTATNLWQAALFAISLQWIGTIGFVAVLGLVGTRFLAYRLHKLWRLDPRLRALPWVAAGVLALGVTEPLILPAAPIVAFGALVALAYDGLRANA